MELIQDDEDYDITFDRRGRQIIMKCSKHGEFYKGQKPDNKVGQNNLVFGQAARHRKLHHGKTGNIPKEEDNG